MYVHAMDNGCVAIVADTTKLQQQLLAIENVALNSIRNSYSLLTLALAAMALGMYDPSWKPIITAILSISLFLQVGSLFRYIKSTFLNIGLIGSIIVTAWIIVKLIVDPD